MTSKKKVPTTPDAEGRDYNEGQTQHEPRNVQITRLTLRARPIRRNNAFA